MRGSPIIYYFSGANTAAKTQRMTELQNILFSEDVPQKLVYLPLQPKQTHSDLEISTARVLMAGYNSSGYSAITNVQPASGAHSSIVEFKTNRLDPNRVASSLKQQTRPAQAAKQSTLLAHLRRGCSFTLDYSQLEPLDSLIATEPSYKEYVRSLLGLHSQISSKLHSAALDTRVADNVLPLGLAVAVHTDLSNVPAPTDMQQHEQHLQINTSYERYIKVASVSPRNELDIIASILYQIGDVSLDAARDDADDLSFDDKVAILQDYTTQAGDKSALKDIEYKLDMCVPGTELQQILASTKSTTATMQLATPLLGYGVPAKIERAGAVDLYQSAFDSSYAMHSLMHSQHGIDLAQHAVLLGHRVRAVCTFNYLDILQSPNKTTLKDIVGTYHPLATSML